jgi:hypothetical protein
MEDELRYYQHFTFVREVFSRDLQRETGQPYTRSRYYHLYINGVYWGLYQTEERPEAAFGATYFGGDNDDYDVVKSNRSWPRSMECVDGTFEAYKRLWQACLDGFDTDEKYYKVQGLDANCTPNPAYEKLVDVDNLVDYMLTIFYTGDFDAPISGWYSNKIPNNFFGVYNRVNPDGFKYFRHDGEHTMLSTSEDRTGPYTDSWLMNFIEDCPVQPWVSQTCIGFNPQTIHQYLTVHPEYKMMFADRVHKHFFNDGPMTVEGAQQIFASRTSEIDMAIIAESARWGDAKTHPPRTKNDWLSEIGWVLNTYMPVRTEIVINQFRNKGWYPLVDAPEFKVNGVFQHGGLVSDTDSIAISSTTPTIYYTINGSDPRLPTSARPLIPQTLIAENATKKVFVPTTDIGTIWKGANEPYDDSAWVHGTFVSGKTGGVGYDNDQTYLPYISYNVKTLMYGLGLMASCYIRIHFNIDGEVLDNFNFMTLKVRCDDGFIAYINGQEVASINKPSALRWNSSCSSRADSTDFIEFPINQYINTLKAGENILAIQAMNASTTSSDFLCSVELIAGKDTSQPAQISPAAIAYTTPFTIIGTTNIKARVFDGSTWSALSDAVFAVEPAQP